MNRRQKIIVSVVGIFLILLILVGLTYAYFLTKIQGNSETKSISVSTANLALVYGDGNGIIEPEDTILPGTTIDSYAVVLEDLKITYANTVGSITAGTVTYLNRPEDFKLTITCTSSVTDKTCNGYDVQVE